MGGGYKMELGGNKRTGSLCDMNDFFELETSVGRSPLIQMIGWYLAG